jgi:hypothetical protein
MIRLFFTITMYFALLRSCWLELAELCVAEKQALPTWQEITSLHQQPQHMSAAEDSYCAGTAAGAGELQEAKIIYACFLVHAYLEKHCGDLAMQVHSYFHILCGVAVSVVWTSSLFPRAMRLVTCFSVVLSQIPST